MTTRNRIVAESMRLFGSNGYSATTIAQIEDAAGLSAGSGGLYKHFPSKRAVLDAGIRERIGASDELPQLLGSLASAPSPRQALRAIAAAGLSRLEAERDLNRILVRDLSRFPDLLELFRTAELSRLHRGLTAALAALSPGDHAATAAVLISAISHYWLLADVYGGKHPLGIAPDAYLDALASLAESAMKNGERS